MTRIRNLVAAAMIAGATLAMSVPAAQAETFWNVSVGFRSDSRGGWDGGHRHRHRYSNHPAHRFFDGRLYCAGTDGWGRWVSDARCEDEYGRKLVNNPRFVQAVLRGERWRDDRYDRRDDRYGWRNDRYGWNR